MGNSLRLYTRDWLEELINSSNSYREVLIKAGRAPSGGESYRLLKNKIKEFGVDDSKIQTSKVTIDDRYRGGNKRKYEKDEIFCKNSPAAQSVLRRYIKRYNMLVYECALCGFEGEDWEGPIALEIDHINGDNKDNRIENLRYLCPNCHAHTETYRGRNKKNKHQ